MTRTDHEPTEKAQHGQEKASFSALLIRNFWALLLLVIVVVACVVIVQVFKKPGQMSVIESQAMDMTVMLPPKGALPVGIAAVKRESISSTLTYTGTVQAFTDEDIYPRVTGLIAKMPVYAGDRVKKGQLLVQLDPSESSEYSARRDEALYQEDAAQHNAGIAKSEFAQKKYQLQAAKDAEQASQKSVDEAKARVDYWKPELERQSALLKQQVISIDEYQKELAEYNSAQSKLEQEQAKLSEAGNLRMAAQADLDTMIHHIGHQSASAKQAEAALKAAKIINRYTSIRAQDDGVVTKRAVSPGVVVSPGALLLKVAHVKQVRVQAEVASEDVENIKLGDKVYIRGADRSAKEITATITAIFPAADAQSRTFTVESLIDNMLPDSSSGGKTISSLSPYKFLPGQYVIMRIVTGASEGLVVPSSAVVWREGKPQVWKLEGGAGASTGGTKYQCPMDSDVIKDKPGKCPKCGMELEPVAQKAKPAAVKSEFTCTMHPEVVSDKPGKCPKCGMNLTPKELGGKHAVELVSVQVGQSNPDKTEIVSGLEEGDEVVYAGHASLQNGMFVVGTEWGETGPAKLPSASELSGNRLDASNNWTVESMLSTLMVKVSLDPAKGGSNSVVVKVDKHGGGAVSGAQITVKTSMPGMNMGGPDLSGTTDSGGQASLKSDLSSGLWKLDVKISPSGEAPVESSFELEVP